MTGSDELCRSSDNKVLAGVCGGIGEHFSIDPTIVRVLWVLFSLFYFTGVIVYIVLMLLMPKCYQTGDGWHQGTGDTSRTPFRDDTTGRREPSGRDGVGASYRTSICPYCDGQIRPGDTTCENCGVSL